MKNRYYSTPERRERFHTEARSWIGTPFSENGSVKGRLGGVDCVHFAAEVNRSCGAIGALEIPILPVEWVRSWHEHHTESKLLAFFSQDVIRARLRRLSVVEEPETGDIAVLRFKQTEHHIGLWCGFEMIHVTTNAGVISASTRNPDLKGQIRSFYRFFEA